jgi:hypothetical protein
MKARPLGKNSTKVLLFTLNSSFGQFAENGERKEILLFFWQKYDNISMYFITGNFPEKENI